MAEKVRETETKIQINEQWCKSCGICIEFCPRDVFGTREDGVPVVESPEDCIECMLCELRCPDFAIVVKGGNDE